MSRSRCAVSRRQRGQTLKEVGQLWALEHSGPVWAAEALDLLSKFVVEHAAAFRFEQFRAWALEHGLNVPASPNAWGALPRLAMQRGMITWTGRYESAVSPATHGHPVKVWVAA